MALSSIPCACVGFMASGWHASLVAWIWRSLDTMNHAWTLLNRTKREFAQDHCTQMAAAIAYNLLFSFIPLITLLLAALGAVLRDPHQQRIAVDRVLAVVPLQSGKLVSDSIHTISAQSGTLSVIGLVGLLWAASGVFGAIRSALTIAWNVKAGRGFITGMLLDLGAMLGLGVMLIGSVAGTMMIHLLKTLTMSPSGAGMTASLQFTITALGVLVPAALSFLVFLLLYRYVPKVRHGVGDVWPGALAATVLFELAKHAFAFYVSHFARIPAVYGALGAVMLFMLWSYLSALILLIGAELASEYERMRHGRPVEDAAHPREAIGTYARFVAPV